MEKNVGRKHHRVERVLARSRQINERPQPGRRAHHSPEQVGKLLLFFFFAVFSDNTKSPKTNKPYNTKSTHSVTHTGVFFRGG